MLVPPHPRMELLLELNLVKEPGHGSVCGQGGKRIRALRDHIWKDVSRSLGILDKILQKKTSKIFSPSQLMRGDFWLCKEVCKGFMVHMYNKLLTLQVWLPMIENFHDS